MARCRATVADNGGERRCRNDAVTGASLCSSHQRQQPDGSGTSTAGVPTAAAVSQAAAPPDPFSDVDAGPSEYDYRAPSYAEQVQHLRDTWPGRRCPHGVPIGAPGPDLICGHCENDAWADVVTAQAIDEHDRTGRWPHPIGPYETPNVRERTRHASPTGDTTPF